MLAAGASLAGCGGAADQAAAPSPSQVEVALYVAIQHDEVSARTTEGATGRPALSELYEIACRSTAFDGWTCSVLLPDDSTVTCTIDRVEIVADEAFFADSPRCKY